MVLSVDFGLSTVDLDNAAKLSAYVSLATPRSAMMAVT
jgi:hypothetical protein